MPNTHIIIRGAREHNLKNVSLEIPRDRLIVFTGVSGSGKSSLAFDTLYAEGQRRYVESLSAYARQFLDRLEKPKVESVDGLSPAISIEQKSASKNPRSTVGTVTEIHDYMRVLWARAGRPYCYQCGRPIATQTGQQIVDKMLALPPGTRIHVLAPLVRGRKGEYRDLFEEAKRDGFARVRVNGELLELDREIKLDEKRKHDIEVVIDRLVVSPDIRLRLAEAVETALRIGEGLVIAQVPGREDILFSEHFACVECGISYGQLEPQMFSFNSPQGMCKSCDGLGSRMDLDPDSLVPDPERSIADGCLVTWGALNTLQRRHIMDGLAARYGFDLHAPWRTLPEAAKKAVLLGSGGEKIEFVYKNHRGRQWKYQNRWEGILPILQREANDGRDGSQDWMNQFMSAHPCPDCGGGRLRRESAAVRFGGRTLVEVNRLSIREALAHFEGVELTEREAFIAEELLKEIRGRLGFLVNVGLDYLTLDRAAPTLSGGEAQRIRLATQIGAGLMGVLYILDEPSIGLHARDNARLLATLKHLRDVGNTVIVVEHDAETMAEADFLVDFGPGAGVRGGYVVAAGTPARVKREPRSLTGQYLSGKLQIPLPDRRRPAGDQSLLVREAGANNLKGIDARFPLGLFVGVTGVSGSGKSTLVNDILYKAVAQKLSGAHDRPGRHRELLGLEQIDKVIDINQQPIGRTPRSNPATYVGVYDPVRELFASLPESKARGYKPGRFSFNVKGGRCETCEGDGIKKIEMHFLSDLWVPCEACGGTRYNRETLDVAFKGKSIADVLDMTVGEAVEHFANQPRIKRILQTLYDVGLEYIKLGQPATTLSGGEAQRVKLAKELCRRSTGRTLYILDEPTTGLHFEDIRKLLEVLNRLVGDGNTVVVIEHNLDVIKTCDWLIDLGPEGGAGGGEIVAEGTPEAVAAHAASYTGQALRPVLALDAERQAAAKTRAAKRGGKRPATADAGQDCADTTTNPIHEDERKAA